MGLDMYLIGEKYLWTNWDNPGNNPTEDGFRVKSRELDLGYWRKHPDLHGYIVEAFADGVDDCRRIHLALEDLNQIVSAIEKNHLPETTGFFFGESLHDAEEKANDLEIFSNAIAWLGTGESGVAKSIYYQASW